MFRCRLCRFEMVLDDVALLLRDGTCICLRCFEREVGDEKRTPKRIRDDAEDASKD